MRLLLLVLLFVPASASAQFALDQPKSLAGVEQTGAEDFRILEGYAALIEALDKDGYLVNGTGYYLKVLRVDAVLEAAPTLGYPPETMFPIGVTLLICTLLYAAPRTAVLGAILLTGYLGGAVATHVRVLNPLFSHSLFPTYFGALIWGGLLLRDARLRAFLPWRARD